MSKIRYMLVVPMGAVLCACACLVGCGREDSADVAPPAQPGKDVSRAHDAAYQEQIKEFPQEMRRILKERAKVESRMAQLREFAKKALPEGATDAQVLAELENNPKKYPAWRELVAAMKENDVEQERNRAAAQSAVRQRIQRESAERAGNAPQEKK